MRLTVKRDNYCTRVYADPEQIRQSRVQISIVESSIKKLSGALNLAGNEVRLKILYLLKLEQKMCPCDLSDVLNMTVPAISQHLRKMKDAGLVIDKKVGQTIFYSIRKEHGILLNPIFELIDEPEKIKL